MLYLYNNDALVERLMQKYRVIAVGKLKEKALIALVGEYVKRLGRYCTLDIIELADESIPAGESEAGVRKSLHIEAGRIFEKLRAGTYTIALDMSGKAPDSAGFAEMLQSLAIRGLEIEIIIGGSHGLHPEVLERADYIMSMSNLTFPHQLARLIILEQLYRAHKIMHNETYHK